MGRSSLWVRWRRAPSRLALVAVCVGGALLEAGALRGANFVEAIPFAPQVTAPPPYGAFHDLRWLIVYNHSWLSLAWEVVLVVVLRGVVTACLARLAWPISVPRPPWPSLILRGLASALLSLIVLSPGATVAFAGGVTSLSWFVLGMLIPLFVTFLVFPHGGFQARWWRRWPPLVAIAVSALTFWVLTAGGLVLTYAPGWSVVPVAGVVGLYNAWAWTKMLAALEHRGAQAKRAPVGAGLLVVTVGVFLVAAVAPLAGFRSKVSVPPGAVGSPPAGSPDGTPLLVVDGFNSSYDGHPHARFGARFLTQHYSYRGSGPNGYPEPYGPSATHQSLDHSARLLGRQIAELHQRTGKPVDLVAVSEGTAVVRLYLAGHPRPPVARVVLTSPLVQPSRVGYPPAGHQGWGLAGGWEARELLSLVHLEDPSITIRADSPFVRSFITHGALLRDRILCPVPGVALHVFLPLASAAVAPPGPLGEASTTVLPAVHGGLVSTGAVRAQVAAKLSGRPVPPQPLWGAAYALVRGSAAAWEIPSLPLAWLAPTASHLPDPAFGGNGCTARGA